VPAHKFTKKDLKQDSFVNNTEKVLEFLQRNATAVGGGLLVLIVLLVGGSYLQQSREASRIEASYMLYQGQSFLSQGDFEAAIPPLQDCVEQHGGTEFGRYARPALVNAMLGAGQAEIALQEAERFASELPADHPAATELALVRANALADAGRYAEAAAAMGELIGDDLEDTVYVQRVLRQAEWLRVGGDLAGAEAALQGLHDRIAAGEITTSGLGREVERQLEMVRALDI
jgi:predicted negative regulator of RcsB-dependent stress response